MATSCGAGQFQRQPCCNISGASMRAAPFDFLFFAYVVDGMLDPAVIAEIRRAGVAAVNFSCNNCHQFHLVREIFEAFRLQPSLRGRHSPLFHRSRSPALVVAFHGVELKVLQAVRDVPRNISGEFSWGPTTPMRPDAMSSLFA